MERSQAEATGRAAEILQEGKEIVLQGFNWESHKKRWYQEVSKRVDQIKGAGFTAIWLPPSFESLAPQGYLPRNLYCLDSAYGNAGELRALLKKLTEAGVRPIADIVINHRIGSKKGRGGQWNRYDGLPMPWDERAVHSDTYHGLGGPSQGAVFEGAPNIDHSQENVRLDIVNWLKWLLHDVGFRGLRFDFAKGYKPEHVQHYISSSDPDFAVGEYWDDCNYSGEPDYNFEYNQNSHRQKIADWIAGTGHLSAAFDFTTKGILQEAVGKDEYWRLRDSEGRPPGLLGLMPSHAISFLDNHDTGSTQGHWPFPSSQVLVGYAYTLTHPGIPSVFWDHFFDWGSDTQKAILELMSIRRRNEITSRTHVEIIMAEHSYAACIGDRLCVKLGREGWSPPEDGWKLAAEGKGYVVWERKH